MNLALDVGNTLTKVALLDAGEVVKRFSYDALGVDQLATLLDEYPEIEAAISVASADLDTAIEQLLERRLKLYLPFDATTPTPLEIAYRTPNSLGADRLAAAVGAATRYPNRELLVVDLGTAITIDRVTASGVFLGGNISAGAQTRLRALHQYTAQLPLGTLSEQSEGVGTTTIEAIEKGVVQGITYELKGYIEALSAEFPDLGVIFTGGDANFFGKKLKSPIFVTCDLVWYGLNRIVEDYAKRY